MRRPEFEAYLHDARIYPEVWRLILGIGLTVLIWIGTTLVILAAAIAVVASDQGAFGIMPYLTGLQTPNTPGTVLLLLATFAGLFIGAMVAAAALHFRGPGTLFGPWEEWRRGFLTGLTVLFVPYALLVGISLALGAAEPNLSLGLWALLLPVGLALLFLQIGAEELFFRGYIQQQLAARFNSRIVWMWLPSIVFAALHVAPQAGANLPLVLLSALTFGLVAADLTERTGSLGAAMGIHFGNNFFGLFIVSLADTISGMSLYVSHTDIGETGLQSLSMAASILVMLAVWGVTVRLLDR
ncbi:MAG: type II CAAX endopeptidase family protein [Pseudomonadota bacterium]